MADEETSNDMIYSGEVSAPAQTRNLLRKRRNRNEAVHETSRRIGNVINQQFQRDAENAQAQKTKLDERLELSVAADIAQEEEEEKGSAFQKLALETFLFTKYQAKRQ